MINNAVGNITLKSFPLIYETKSCYLGCHHGRFSLTLVANSALWVVIGVSNTGQ